MFLFWCYMEDRSRGEIGGYRDGIKLYYKQLFIEFSPILCIISPTILPIRSFILNNVDHRELWKSFKVYS